MRKIILSTLLLMSGTAAFAQTAVVTPDPIPVVTPVATTPDTLSTTIADDQAKITADRAALAAARTTLATDTALGDPSTIATDQAAVDAARTALRADLSTLRTDAKAYLATDKTAIQTAFTQLKADVLAGNATAIAADRLAIKAAFIQAQTDRVAVFGTASNPGEMHGEKNGWFNGANGGNHTAKEAAENEDNTYGNKLAFSSGAAPAAPSAHNASPSGQGNGHSNNGEGHSGSDKGHSKD
jgi:hypothetical protein